MRRTAAITLFLALASIAAPARAAVTLQTVGSFTDPVYVTSEPNDSGRLLVVEQRGVSELAENGVVTPYLDIHDSVATGGERGLLSVALSPDYATSGLLYVYYTRSDPDPALNGDLQIDEYRASSGAVSPASRRPVLTIDHVNEATNHNGGQLQFGPDGFLYLATGDGAVNPSSAQSLDSLLGKVLRIRPYAAAGAPYTVPANNPFVGVAGADEIWSYGLRNPWRFSFDRLTGDLVIADVGSSAWEEIDYEPAPNGGRGDNFGWPRCEGMFVINTSNPCDVAGATPPVYQYPHGGTCAITGGYVVRDESLGDLYGRYLFADLCNGAVSSIRLGLPAATDVRGESLTALQPSSFGEDSCGRIYLAALGSDRVYRFVGDSRASCPPGQPGPVNPGGSNPAPTTCAGETVTRAALPTGGRVVGTAARDVIAGSDRKDRIAGRGGGDVICAGDGNDAVNGGGGGDDLRGGAGADELNGGGGGDRCKGGPGRDRLSSC
jgi:glucose/arabinose dehydrogenase